MKQMVAHSEDLGYVASIDTYGLFTGDQADENLLDYYNEEHNTSYEWDDFDWEYDHANIVREFAEVRAKFLEESSDALKSVEVINTGSPREYNFGTDYAMFKIDYDEGMVESFIKENQADYDNFYRESGWAAHTEWREDTDRRKAENIERAKLDYYLNKTIDWDEAYYALAEEEYRIYEENTKMTLKEGK